MIFLEGEKESSIKPQNVFYWINFISSSQYFWNWSSVDFCFLIAYSYASSNYLVTHSSVSSWLGLLSAFEYSTYHPAIQRTKVIIVIMIRTLSKVSCSYWASFEESIDVMFVHMNSWYEKLKNFSLIRYHPKLISWSLFICID